MINDFLNTLKGKIVGAIIGVIIVFLVAQWDAVVDTFDKGAQVEKQVDFNTMLIEASKDKEVVKAFLESESFVNVFFSSPLVQKNITEIGNELHAEIINQRISKDSTKVSMRDYNAAGLNMHPDSVLPFQLSIFKYFKALKNKGVSITTSSELNDLKDVLEYQSIKTEKPRRRTDAPIF